ncbi:serine hydrolase BPHL-like isoform X2 [Babylonia areolata]|uniref:serine hydrolase BPHL-like isoform X2 n=1 Tax=Babylonia areolata TaxID=304850 RepID=UPI003FD59344
MLNIAVCGALRLGQRCAARLSVVQDHVGQAVGLGRQLCTSSAITSYFPVVNGVRIHYEKTGTGNHTLLLLPGALGSSRTDFSPQLETLSKEKYTIIAMDPRGYGRSIPPERDWPLGFFQRDADDAVALMESLDQTQFSILGWSDGGITGLIIAGRYPHLMKRLVVWGANAYVSPADIAVYREYQDVSKWSEKMKRPFMVLYGKEYFQRNWSLWINAYERYMEKRKGDICIQETKNVKCPTLIIHGQKDPLVPQEHPDFLAANIPGAKLVNWPEAKHNLHLRYPEEFKNLVEPFLDSDN